MATEFKLPELGENVHGGDVLRVLVKAGDAVSNEQPVLELETDKATIEVPSSVSGTVGEISVKPGEKVKVGQTIFTVADNAAASKAPAADSRKPEAASPRPEAESRKPEAESPEPEAESRKPGAAQRASIPRAPEDQIDE